MEFNSGFKGLTEENCCIILAVGCALEVDMKLPFGYKKNYKVIIVVRALYTKSLLYYLRASQNT